MLNTNIYALQLISQLTSPLSFTGAIICSTPNTGQLSVKHVHAQLKNTNTNKKREQEYKRELKHEEYCIHLNESIKDG